MNDTKNGGDEALLTSTRSTCTEGRGRVTAERLVEFRAYRLKPGTVQAFEQVFVEESLPLHQRWGMDVVAFGSPPDTTDQFFLIRAYADHDHREASQAAFYASADWVLGPREAIVRLIDSDSCTLACLPEPLIDALRNPSHPEVS